MPVKENRALTKRVFEALSKGDLTAAQKVLGADLKKGAAASAKAAKLALPDVKRKLVDEGANELIGSTPDALARLIHMDIQKYRKLIADSGIKIQ